MFELLDRADWIPVSDRCTLTLRRNDSPALKNDGNRNNSGCDRVDNFTRSLFVGVFLRLPSSASLDVTDGALDRPRNQRRAANTRQHYVTARPQAENCDWNSYEDIGENERAIHVLRCGDVLCLKARLMQLPYCNR